MNGIAVQRDESMDQERYRATGTDSASAYQPRAQAPTAAELKQLAAERLAAHRTRRAQAAASEAEREELTRVRAEAQRRKSSQGASRVRDAVAARYQQSVTYREYLAVEAERALDQAQAEAEVAARKARAVAEAQMQLLEEIEQWNEPAPSPREKALAEQRATTRDELAHALADIALGARELMAEPPTLTIMELGDSHFADTSMPEGLRLSSLSASSLSAAGVESSERSGGLQVRLHEQLGPVAQPLPMHALAAGALGASYAPGRAQTRLDELDQLDQLDREIEFRRDPEFQEHTLQALPIQANIIEFPRQLIAPRKARPRLAEGPLLEDGSPQPQLRIFEVEAEQISVDTMEGEGSGAPEWQSLLLDAPEPAPLELGHHELDVHLRPDTAPASRRMLALAVDACCIGAGFVGFGAVIARIGGPIQHQLALPVLGAAVTGTLLAFTLLYQMLFFTWAEATPGMRCARIALCTFNDETPTRSAMRRRILATLVAACPLGLGLIWMALDNDRLGWHDRISRMYPRAY